MVIPAIGTHGSLFVTLGFPSTAGVTSLHYQHQMVESRLLEGLPAAHGALLFVLSHAAYSDSGPLEHSELMGHIEDARSQVTGCSPGDVPTAEGERGRCSWPWEGHGL